MKSGPSVLDAPDGRAVSAQSRTSASRAISSVEVGRHRRLVRSDRPRASTSSAMPVKPSVPSRNLLDRDVVGGDERRARPRTLRDRPSRPMCERREATYRRPPRTSRSGSWSTRSRRGAGDGRRSGKVNAYWMGMRISGRSELCLERAVGELDHRVDDALRVDDDIDLDRRRHRTASVPRSTSSALFMSVAESIVTLAPIVQVGCASASSWRGRREALGGQSRNGPPEAVRINRLHVGRSLTGEALPDGRVLGVDRPQPRQRHASRPAPHERPAHGRAA